MARKGISSGILIPVAKLRKYPHSWELTQLANGQLCCINTHRSNQLVFEALQNKQIKELAMYDEIYPEVNMVKKIAVLIFYLKAKDCRIAM